MRRVTFIALTTCALNLAALQTAAADPAGPLTGRVVRVLVPHGASTHLLLDQRLAQNGARPSWVQVVPDRGPGAGEPVVARLAPGDAARVGDLVELGEDVPLDPDAAPRPGSLVVRAVTAAAHAAPSTPPATRMTVVREDGRLFVRAVPRQDPPILLARP
jgi:hypothetical protein